jgi:Family of unknown function (DUF6229)
MSAETVTSIAQTVSAWRASASPDSPAGPLFPSGRYAESEITMSGKIVTLQCGTNCTGSEHDHCC